jgi:mannose/cellobiose epimerase-like protein (N-acyl-D-glucosamine 2-epimerase family)
LLGDVEERWLLAESRRLLTFARGALAPRGGYASLDDRGQREERPFELYVNCRMTHVFGLGVALWPTDFQRHLTAGIQAVDTIFADRVHGGWSRSSAPEPQAYTKTAYDHAFVILAASSSTARGVAGAHQLLRRALQIVDAHFWDDEHGLVRESFTCDWSRCEPYRGTNANMHAVEAFLAAADVLGDDNWRTRAMRIADRVVNEWARQNDWRIPEHFDENWAVDFDYNIARPAHPFRPYGSTVGHGMEWARLCLHLDAATGAPGSTWLADAAAHLYARAKIDGWARDGAPGFVYTVDWRGSPVVHERMHWVAAEAAAAAAALHAATGDNSYAADFHLWWDYIRTHMIDYENGSWHHELSRTNGPSATVWPGKADAYHAVQACLIPLLPLQPVAALSVTGLRDRID